MRPFHSWSARSDPIPGRRTVGGFDLRRSPGHPGGLRSRPVDGKTRCHSVRHCGDECAGGNGPLMRAALDLSAYPPDGMEIRLIERFASLRGKRVLEVGCGDGRLTVEYAPGAASVVAMDSFRSRLDLTIDSGDYQGLNSV